jgi:hypothetical protein
VTQVPILRVAGWLVPDNERGEAILGDLEEIYADWTATRGSAVAALRLIFELVRSFPAFVWTGIAERGGAALVLRSVPALMAGGLLFAGLLGICGAIPPGTIPAILLGIAAMTVFSTASGWLAAALAGAAPRQHALALGVGLTFLSLTMLAIGRGESTPWYWILLQIPIVPAAAYGGRLYWRSNRLPGDDRPGAA